MAAAPWWALMVLVVALIEVHRGSLRLRAGKIWSADYVRVEGYATRERLECRLVLGRVAMRLVYSWRGGLD